MTRKMATIRRIKQLLPIAGADRIEIALVDGWQVVVQKGQFEEGELAVFCEIDSWIPSTIAPFLTDTAKGKLPNEFNGVKGERLKTTKRLKTLSQGLLLSLRAFPEIMGKTRTPYDVAEGEDVTDVLGIQKWEAPEEKSANNGAMASKTRSFPYFIRKTDQERAQNYGAMIDKNLDTPMEVTVKKDGSSMTVFRVMPGSEYYADAKLMVEGKPSLWQRLKKFVLRESDKPVFGICSRNVLLSSEGNSNFHKAADRVLVSLALDADVSDLSFAVQGEVVAPDIQGNYEKVDSVEFHMFDLFDIDKQQYVLPRARRDWAYVNSIKHATVVDKGTLRSILQLNEGEDAVQKLLTYASGEGDNPGVQREGVVFKADTTDFSFKVVSNEYLLHKEKQQ
jgi:RNA ligase (TIGR02306 family)